MQESLNNLLLITLFFFCYSVFAADANRARGIELLDELTNTTAINRPYAELAAFYPEVGEWIRDFAFGDVLSRPALDIRTREVITISVLTAQGNALPQLKVHIEGALNVGCKPNEIVEAMLQMSVYAGFPASMNGLNAAREVFIARGISFRSG